MIRKMIRSLDIHELKDVLEGVESRLFWALLPSGEKSENDYSKALTHALYNIRTAMDELDSHYRQSLLDRLRLTMDDKKLLASNMMSRTIDGIKYIREIYPDISIREAKDRWDLWNETGG